MQISQVGPTPLLSDNQRVLELTKNPILNERTKHVETHCHFIWQLVEDRSIQLLYVPTMDQTADILTKSLSSYKFVKFRGSIGVVDGLTLREGINIMFYYLFNAQ